MPSEHHRPCDPAKASHEIAIAIGIIIFASMLACAPMFWYGASNGFDSSTALVWERYFSQQLLGGDLYPRWLMGANRGAGSPAFYFYAPLPYYIISVPTALLPSVQGTIQLAWGDWLLLMLSGTSFYICARVQFHSNVALACSILYMVLPYHYEVDLWTRQDLAELTNYIWMPLTLSCLEDVLTNGENEARLAGCYALMLASHLPSTILFTLCLGAYIATHIGQTEFLPRMLRVGRALFIGVSLAGAYWVPAYFCQRYIHSEAWWSWSFDYHLWFFPVKPLEAFRGFPSLRAINIRIFEVVGITTSLLMLLTWASVLEHGLCSINKLKGYLAMAAFAWFLMTPASEFVWETLPFLPKVQFPSRLSMIVDLATALTALHGISRMHRTKPSVAMIIVGCILSLAWCTWSADLKTKLRPFDDQSTLARRDDHVRNGVDAPEYTTVWSPFSEGTFDNSIHIANRPLLSYDVHNGFVKLRRWKRGRIELMIELKAATSLVIRQFYFPSWRAESEDGRLLPLVPSKQDGLISVPLPAGKYQVRLRLVPLPQEVVGYLVSFLGLGMLWGVSPFSVRDPGRRSASSLSDRCA